MNKKLKMIIPRTQKMQAVRKIPSMTQTRQKKTTTAQTMRLTKKAKMTKVQKTSALIRKMLNRELTKTAQQVIIIQKAMTTIPKTV